MLNTRLKNLLPTTKFLSTSRLCFWLPHYPVKEVRGDCLYVLEDKSRELQFMREIETEDGRRGIVLKIEDLSTTYVGMYEAAEKGGQKEVKLRETNISWQASVLPMNQAITAGKEQGVFNVNGKSISGFLPQTQNQKSPALSRNLLSLTPLLDVCYNLQYGELFHFTGCLGSRKTQILSKIMKQFNSHQRHLSLYLNPTSVQEVGKAVQECNSWGFSNGKTQTDIGVYMLALKTIHLAKLLSKQGLNVLIGFDNFKDILQAEWHMLQLLTNTASRKSGDFISYNAPKIAPLSIINELYASCNDLEKSRGKEKGSFTAVILSDSDGKGDQTPQITPYSNNLKHLASLAQKVDFPLALRHNYHNAHQPVDPFNPHQLSDYVRAVRNHINEYLREKQESQLKRKLYKSDMRDAPWDYYALLDAQWWLQGLQTIKVGNEEEETQFLRWIILNIQQELIPHWKIKCNEAFTHYKAFLEQDQTHWGAQGLQKFVGWAKLEGLFSPFKKDYLN